LNSKDIHIRPKPSHWQQIVSKYNRVSHVDKAFLPVTCNDVSPFHSTTPYHSPREEISGDVYNIDGPTTTTIPMADHHAAGGWLTELSGHQRRPCSATATRYWDDPTHTPVRTWNATPAQSFGLSYSCLSIVGPGDGHCSTTTRLNVGYNWLLRRLVMI